MRGITGRRTWAACALLAVAVSGCGGPKPVTEDQKIEHLLSFIGGLKGATIIIEEDYVDAAAAEGHFRKVWEARRAAVRTAADFIREVASFSAKDGSRYLVKLPDGSEVFLRDHLTAELKRYEREIWRNL